MAFLPKRASHDNPFNAINTQHIPNGLNFPESELRAELKRRGLPDTGSKRELTKRLKAENQWLLTRAGMYEVHLRKLADLEKAAKATRKPQEEETTFHLFPNLPNEIRHMIWRLSLPGPRVLSVSDEQHFSDRLYFRKGDNQENPTALIVSRESRAIALEKYHLSFGTPNIYVDFGKDILYFGSHWKEYYNFMNVGRSSLWDWDEIEREEEEDDDDDDDSGKLFQPNDVVSSIQAVQHLALHPHCWAHYAATMSAEGGRNHGQDLEHFLRLRSLLLVQHDPDNRNPGNLSSYTPGHIELEECSMDEHPVDSWRRPQGIDLRDKIEKRLIGSEETSIRTLDIKFVDAKRVLKIPGEDWEFSWGEPYYPPIEDVVTET